MTARSSFNLHGRAHLVTDSAAGRPPLARRL